MVDAPRTDREVEFARERDEWRKLAKALDTLLVAYRADCMRKGRQARGVGGRRTPAKAIDDARAAREALRAMGVEDA